MNFYSEGEFLRWANNHGLGFDSQYPDSNSLRFLHGRRLDRFWIIPKEAEARLHLISSLLDACGPWTSFRCWRHLGMWFREEELDEYDPDEIALFLSAGVPLGSQEVIEYNFSEKGRLLSLLYWTTVFVWSLGEDLTLVPDSAQGILKTDHHGVIHVLFSEDRQMMGFIGHMEDEGFPLPKKPPDSSFRIPDWMRG